MDIFGDIMNFVNLILSIVLAPESLLLLIFPGLLTILLAAAAIIWFERKFLAKIQLRVGPQYAGRFGGILQPVADFLKLIFKENIVPDRADSLFYQLSPLLLVTLAATSAAIVPVGPALVIADIQLGLLFFLAVGAVVPATVLLIAWASNSVYPFLGGLRGLLQIVAYEVPLWLSAVGVVLFAGSFNLTEIVMSQGSFWYGILMPIGAIVFFIALLVEIERIPFDLPEAEPEIVTGYMSEYSGMSFGLLMMSQYLKLYVGSLLFTVLFLGGWTMPDFIPVFIPPVVWTFVKTAIVIVFLLLPRAIFPRYKLSQLLKIGWNRLFALAVLNLILAVGIQIFFFGGIS